MPRLAVYGGTFDPPGRHRRQIVRQLAECFDEVIVIPFGPRPDGDTAPIHRAVMADLCFGGVEKVTIDPTDLDRPEFTPIWRLEERYAEKGEVWLVVPAIALRGGSEGTSQVQTQWERGRFLWTHSRFIVLEQRGHPTPPGDLPPRHEILTVESYEAAAEIRRRIYENRPAAELLAPEILAYVRRYGLYRGQPPITDTDFLLERPRFRLVADERNPEAMRIADLIQPFVSDTPDMIVVLGGDGTMLRAIREHWRKRLPFYGLNTGHLGFLLNPASTLPFWRRRMRLYQLPLLDVDVVRPDGSLSDGMFAFNDAWVERVTGQTAWLQLSVNGEVRIPKLVADGLLVSTAAGSTSYARAMGATPVPLNMPAMIVVGSNVLKPESWGSMVLPLGSGEVELVTLDPSKRPLRGFVDGEEQGPVQSMRVRASRIAAVEIAFMPESNPVRKLLDSQLGSVGPVV